MAYPYQSVQLTPSFEKAMWVAGPTLLEAESPRVTLRVMACAAAPSIVTPALQPKPPTSAL